MAELNQDEKVLLFSLLTNIAETGRETVMQLKNANSNILEVARTTKILLSCQKDKLRSQMVEHFVGKSGPKRRLIELYLTIGDGKTRNELVNAGFAKGTVLRYCAELVAETLLQVKETQTNGEEVLEYTCVEEITRLSQHLEELVQTN